MDPEYYMTQQLTDKSDVYSFGVVLLELLTARAPIQQGKYIVKEVKEAKDKLNDSYDFHKILDPVLASDPNLEGITKFVNLAMSCVKDSSDERPRMSEVVREIENIIQLARKNVKSASTLPSHKGEADGDLYNDYGENDHENYDSYGTVTDSDYSRPAVPFGIDLR